MMHLGDAELGSFLDLNATALGLELSDASRAGVLLNLRMLAQHGERVMAFELPPETPLGVDFQP